MKIIKTFIGRHKTIKVLHRLFESIFQLPQEGNLESVTKKFEQKFLSENSCATLDIGCGSNPKNPFNAKKIYGIDIRENLELGIKYADLTVDNIPFEDKFFDYITAYDFLEHVPRVIYLPTRRFPFVELMNEIWRTLKPNGIFLSYTPCYPFPAAFQDPTHVNILTHETFSLYFDDKVQWAKMYGFKGSFKILHQALVGDHLVSVLQKCNDH